MSDTEREKSKKIRLDVLLLQRGLAHSRERAQAMIFSGHVLVNGQKTEKAGTLVAENAELRITGEVLPFVSKGGIKLEAALREFQISVEGKVALDVGASTGGFTDCLLQHGAIKVYAVDVGYGQMAWKLRQDPRVVVIERTNIREIVRSLLPDQIDVAVVDVSFISLEKVIPVVLQFLKHDAGIVGLIKPQFEVGRGQVGKGGVVRDEAARMDAVRRVEGFVRELGLEVKGIVPSPITGRDGNVEYLIYAIKRGE